MPKFNSYSLFVPSGPNNALVSEELPTTAVTGHPYFNHRAVTAIFNPSGSGKVIHVNRITAQCAALNTNSLISSPLTFSVIRGTTTPDGLDVSSDMIMMDSDVTIPSDIKTYFRSSADSVSGFTTIRKSTITPFTTKTAAMVFKFSNPGGGGTCNNYNFQGHYFGMGGSTDVQEIVLRQNETMAITPSNIGNSYVVSINICFKIDNDVGYINVDSTALDGTSTIAIRNENSTKIVYIQKISIEEAALNTAPSFTIERIDAISVGEGNDTIESLTPITLDTMNPWPTDLIVKKNPQVITGGAKYGALIIIPVIKKIIPYPYGITPGVAGGIIGGMLDSYDCWSGGAFADKNRDSNIVLREGEGIGIFNRSLSARSPFAIAMRLDVYNKENIYFGF